MFQRIAFWCALIVLAMACIPVPSYGQANQGVVVDSVTKKAGIEGEVVPECNPSQEKITLEKLNQLFGAQNVCGAQCGFGFPKCRISCGDAATCYMGFCIWL